MKLTKKFTERESLSISKYLNDISKQPSLTAEEEIELAIKMRAGDMQAYEKLIKSNLRFVVSVAKHYQNQGLSLSDLINEGNLGLIKAVKRFDVTKGFKFISYAVWWIRQSIIQAINENSRIVRVPLNKVGALTKLNKIYSRLEQQFEREPTPDEIAGNLEINLDDFNETIKIIQRKISLDASIDADENTYISILKNEDSLSPDKVLIEESLKVEIYQAIKTLNLREQEILKLYFGIDVEQALTLEEIGKKLNLTRERVRQIKEKALRKLKRSKISAKLKQYLG